MSTFGSLKIDFFRSIKLKKNSRANGEKFGFCQQTWVPFIVIKWHFSNYLIFSLVGIWLFFKKIDDKAFIFVNHTFITLGIVSFEQNFECVACIFTIFKENWIVTNGFLWASVVSKVKKIHYCLRQLSKLKGLLQKIFVEKKSEI